MVRAAGDSGFIAWADAVDADGVADAAALAAHLADTVDAHDATAVSFSPAQGIAATTVQAAIEEVVTDAAATYVLTALPTDVPSHNTAGRYDQHLNLYTPTGASLRKTQAKLASVQVVESATSRAKIAWIGHSHVAGYGGTPGTKDAPVALRQLLAARFPVGTGLVTAYNNNNATGAPVDARWSFAAEWTYAGGAYGAGNAQLHRRCQSSAKAATFTSDVLGTDVDIWSFGNTASFSYAVKDNTAATIASGTFTPNGQNAQQVLALTGLTNAQTVVITTTSASSTYLLGVNVRQASCVEVSGMGFYGAEALDWLPVPTSIWYNANQDAIAITPDLVIVQLDANEALHGKTTATLQTNLAAVVASFAAASEVLLVLSCQPTGSVSGGAALTGAQWTTYREAVYDVADSAGVPLVDMTDRFGPYATANANGLMADVNHPGARGYADTALAVCRVIGGI